MYYLLPYFSNRRRCSFIAYCRTFSCRKGNIYICVCVCVCVCVSGGIVNILDDSSMDIYIYIHIYTYICVCVCVFQEE